MHGPYRVIRNAPYPLRRQDASNAMTISQDGGAFAAPTNVPVETPAASGVWFGELTAAEMTADHIMVLGVNLTPLDTLALIPEPAFDSGVAQAGSATTITLRAGAPAFGLVGTMIEIVRGTGKDSTMRMITAYDTGTKVATIRPDWSTNPDNTSVYRVYENPKVNPMQLDGNTFAVQALSELYYKNYKTGTIGAGSTTSIIQTSLTGYGTKNFKNSFLMCLGATNYGIVKPIGSYNSSTGAFTLSEPFESVPLNTEGVAVFGAGG